LKENSKKSSNTSIDVASAAATTTPNTITDLKSLELTNNPSASRKASGSLQLGIGCNTVNSTNSGNNSPPIESFVETNNNSSTTTMSASNSNTNANSDTITEAANNTSLEALPPPPPPVHESKLT